MKPHPVFVLLGVLWFLVISYIFFSTSAHLNDFNWPQEDGILVYTWDPISTHNGAVKEIDLRIAGAPDACQNGEGKCSSFVWGDPNSESTSYCPVRCEFTTSKSRFDHADVVLFHPDQYNSYKFKPMQRAHKNQLYAAFGHEPVWQRPSLWLNPYWTGVFDFTFHWGLNADVQTSFYYLDEYHFQRDPGEWWREVDVEHWRKELPELYSHQQSYFERLDRNDPEVFRTLSSMMVSDCLSKERDKWMKELVYLLPTASYGKCWRNVWKSETKRFGLTTQEAMDGKTSVIAAHPFHFAMESTGKEAGFITEKLFQAFLAGTVPIYFGDSERIRDMVPEYSFIDASEFDSMEDLVSYILYIGADVERYMKYHQWRYDAAAGEVFQRLVTQGRLYSPCRLCMYAKEEIERRRKERRGAVGDGHAGLVYTREDGWERVDTYEKFKSFKKRHKNEVFAVVYSTKKYWHKVYEELPISEQYVRQAVNASSHIMDTISEAKSSTLEEWEVWVQRTSSETLIDRYQEKSITFT